MNDLWAYYYISHNVKAYTRNVSLVKSLNMTIQKYVYSDVDHALLRIIDL